MRKLLNYLKGYEKETVLAPLFKMLEACFELLVPIVVANIIDNGVREGNTAILPGQFGLMVLRLLWALERLSAVICFTILGRCPTRNWTASERLPWLLT